MRSDAKERASPRLACLFLPALPLQAVLRAEPARANEPLAIVQGEGGRARIGAATPKALQLGVRPGLTVAEAEARAPGLLLRRPAPALVQAACDAAFDAVTSVSPRVEPGRPGVVYADATGLGLRHGDERGVAAALAGAASRVGLQGRVGIASGKRLAALAAVHGDGLEVVAPGQERAFLGPLPLAALGADARTRDTLLRWGVSTAGELAALPSAGVGTRLGAVGAALHKLASGLDDHPLQPQPAPLRFAESLSLDHELVNVEALLFLLRPPLEQLLERLDCHALACGQLALVLRLDPSGEARVPVELAAATRDLTALLSLCRSALELHPPDAPVRGIELVATPARVRTGQLALFGRPSIAPEKLAAAVAKVAAIVGPGRTGRVVLSATHDPAADALATFAPPEPSGREEAPTLAPRCRPLALRRFRPPLPAEVRVGPRGLQALRAPGVVGFVVSFAGPFRLDPIAPAADGPRDHWDAELSDGSIVRLVQAGSGWSVVGRYE